MNYLEIVRLKQEPFSNSPDPDNFFPADTHQLCLNRLEIAIRLKRGLNIIYGPVGTGKSTLCRRLFANLIASEGMEPRMLFDAGEADSLSFVRELLDLFGDAAEAPVTTAEAGIGRLQSLIFQLALEKGRMPVLLIDEGQKLTPAALEVLRVLLNFETNTEKLIQIVIFAQPEFKEAVSAMPNFKDRVNEVIDLRPMTEKESIGMLLFRLKKAGAEDDRPIFTSGALKLIHQAGEGRPRQMLRLAHLSLLSMIMAGKSKVDADIVRGQIEREGGAVKSGSRKGAAVILTLIGLTAAAGLWWVQSGGGIPVGLQPYADKIRASLSSEEPKPAEVMPAPEVKSLEQTVVVVPPKPETIPEPPAAPTVKEPVPSEQPAADPVHGLKPEKQLAKDDKAVAVPRQAVLNLREHLSLEDAARLIYSTPKAVPALRKANPDYENDPEKRLLVLPRLRFSLPPFLLTNSLLAFGEFDSLQDAYDAMPAVEKLNPRLAARENNDGRVKFYLLARTSFSDSSRVWNWLAAQKPPEAVVPRILPPYAQDEPVFVAFPGADDDVKEVLP
ncbi:MAG: AAA family ATPase [Sutterella sp.]|nr:AAA family ATPase [Sutterella sp.]